MTQETQSRDARPVAIGRYRVADVLGTGAMGIVYKAHDPVIGRDVAIKVVRINADSQEERITSIDRFRQEVQAAGRCNHAGIVGVFDFLDQDGDPAIVMELVEGASLLGSMRDPARRARLSVVAIALQVLDALGYAHGQGIIHRDIKPANILLTPSGQVKIADFGIARLSGSHTTQTGAMLGTPSYMAPEQVTAEIVDRRADLFAVGAIIYEMFAGRAPFAGRTMAETLLRLSGPMAADLAPVAAAGGRAYLDVLRRALAKDRTQRFQTAEAFAAELEAASRDAAKGDLVADGVADDPLATIVVSSPDQRRLRTPAPPTVGYVWDASLLQRVERQLARFVGPMARVLVARAAREVTGPDALYATLARGLPNATDRSLFLRAVGSGRIEPSLGGGTWTAPQTTASRSSAPRTVAGSRVMAPRVMTLSGPATVPPEAAAAAQAALVVHVGPIARVLVREAAAQAVSGRDFIDRLCAHVTKPEELTLLRRRLRAEVEPRPTPGGAGVPG